MKVYLQDLLVDRYTLIKYRVVDMGIVDDQMNYLLYSKDKKKYLYIDESNLCDFIKPSVQDYYG